MTAVTVAVVDPVHAALGVQRGELWVPGLPDTCPTCRGVGGRWLPNAVIGSYRRCGDCNGTGHLSVSGPTIILSTDGHIQGTATNVEKVPIVALDDIGPEHETTAVLTVDDELGATWWPRGIDGTGTCLDTSFGPWEPGGVALHFTGIRPEIDCPDPLDYGDKGSFFAFCFDEDLDPASQTASLAWCEYVDEHNVIPCPISYPSAPVEPCITRIEVMV